MGDAGAIWGGARFPRVVGVEAAVDCVAARDQRAEPSGIGSNARSRDADASRMHLEATDRIDGRFTEHDVLRPVGADPEVSAVFAGTRGHPTPDPRPGGS